VRTDGAGLQIGNTALSSYIVDSYYEHAMDIITFYTVVINVSLDPCALKLSSNIAYSFPLLLNRGS
jgi:hypothetical protein